MFREYFLVLLLGHILGDFYTQTAKIAENIIISIPVMSLAILILDIAASLLHAFIDVFKFVFIQKKKREGSWIFILDQSLHFGCLIVLAYIWTKNNIRMQEMQFVSNFFTTVNLSEILVCKWILGILLIHKPANILIQKLIGVYKPKAEENVIKADNNAGRVIGTVERVIMLILIYVNQFAAMGLVLTAKSIARYDRISKDEKFAEYYLLGTLISAGIVIACAVMLF